MALRKLFCKSIVVMLFLALLLPLSNISTVSAQADQKYQSLALSLDDLPVPLKVEKITWGSETVDTFITIGGDRSELAKLGAKLDDPTEKDIQYMYITGFHHLVRFTVTMKNPKMEQYLDPMWKNCPADVMSSTSFFSKSTSIMIFQDEEKSKEVYNLIYDAIEKRGGIESVVTPIMNIEKLSKTYGEESFGFYTIGNLHRKGTGPFFGFVPTSIPTLGEGELSDYTIAKKGLIFVVLKIKNVLATLVVQWFEDYPQKVEGYIPIDIRQARFNEEATLAFERDINVKDAGLIIAQKWSERLKREIQGQPSASSLRGRVTDGRGNPMPFLQISVRYDGKDYPGPTDIKGDYQVQIPGFTPDPASPKEVMLTADFSYERDGANRFQVCEPRGPAIHFEKRFKLAQEADKTQNIDFGNEAKTKGLGKLAHYAPIYYHLHEAVDFTITELKANVGPVTVRVGGTGGTYYSGSSATIYIDASDASYSSTDRPKNREYHEYAHHIMYSTYGSWPDDPPGTVNHAGYINPSTSDSYCEGFAEFIASAIAKYSGDPSYYNYAGIAYLDFNYEPWDLRGNAEELAAAGVLWDLYDDTKDRGDDISLTLQEIWEVLKDKRNNFFDVYGNFTQKYPDKKEEIDAIFIEHGFFADTDVGNKQWDSLEPLIDTDWNGVHDPGETYVDLAAEYTTTIENGQPVLRMTKRPTWNKGEDVGRASNYERPDRRVAGRIPSAYLKVTDPQVRMYKVTVHINNPQDGQDFSYLVDVREGKIYLMPPPSKVDVTITVEPESQDYVTENLYQTTTAVYLRKFYDTPLNQGYCDTHTFTLKPTGTSLDPPYETFDGAEPTYDTEDKFKKEDTTSPTTKPEPTYTVAFGGFILVIVIIAAIALAVRRRTAPPRKPPPAVPVTLQEAKPPTPQRPAEEMTKCSTCKTLNPPSNNFCKNCGAPLPQHAYCEECGRRIPAGASYCRYCGDKQGVV